MKPVKALLAILLIAAAAMVVDCHESNNVGPGDAPPPAQCTVVQTSSLMNATIEGAPYPVCDMRVNPLATPCACADSVGPNLPPNVFDFGYTRNGHLPGDSANKDGCAVGRVYANQDCALVAEASGVVNGGDFSNDDDDFSIDMCLDPQFSFVDPFTAGSVELRDWDHTPVGPSGGSFATKDMDRIMGRFHIEVQGCHYYAGEYHFPAGIANIGKADEPARPQAGDVMSAAGDWIADSGFISGATHGDWSELHEARILAVTRQGFTSLDKINFVSLISGFFADQTRQNQLLHLDVEVPKPVISKLNKLTCTWSPDISKTPPCTPKSGVSFSTVADPDHGVCTFEAHRDPAMLAAHGFGCVGTCNHQDFDASSCDNIDVAGAMVATWTDPGDLWVCHNCGCDDPSASGALIAAPVQGCAQAGLDPNNPQDQQTACAQVCAGLICGAAPACAIGECHPPAAGASAALLAASACDPAAPKPLARVAQMGDYHVALDGGASSATFTIDDKSATVPVGGELFFNVAAGAQNLTAVDFSYVRFLPGDFKIAGASVTSATLATAERVFAQASNGSLTVPAGVGVFVARGFINGKPAGQNVINPQGIPGAFDLASRTFQLNIAATDPAADHPATMNAALTGTIDNVPPVAKAGGPVRTVECTSPTTTPVTLDGTNSFDTDQGDSITHFQWFTGDGAGVANHAAVLVNLPIGSSSFALHVYDHLLASSQDPLIVKVVDTIPPVLTVAPTSFCLWPPNHKRVHFHMGIDFSATAVDTCDLHPTVKIISAVTSEPESMNGAGNTANDVVFGPEDFCVRRERSGLGDGRVYTITIEAKDFSGNASTQTIQVTVPHDHMAGCAGAGQEIAEDAPCQ